MSKSSHIILKLSTAVVFFMSACGGGAGGSANPITIATSVTQVTPPVTTPTAPAVPPITNLTVISTASAVQTSVPITFGQPFKSGDLPAGSQLEARDAIGNSVPLQMDEASSHADGSVRFAVLSAQLSNLLGKEQRVVNLYRATTPASKPAATSFNTSAFDLTLVATVYSQQMSVITFGNRTGTAPGTPYLAGEQITLQLGDTAPEQYTLTVSAAQAGGGYPSLTKIAEAFMALINASSQNYRATKTGEGGGYERLWITTQRSDSPAFGIKFVYAGTAVQAVTHQQTYQTPRTYQATPRPVLDAMLAAGQDPRLGGAVAHEYTVVAPFVDTTTGTRHPQLTARLHTRFLEGGQRVRTDMVIENNWTYAPNPGNITYELTVLQGSQTIHHQPTFTHNHHARWHKVLWTGAEPQAQVRHNMRYFLDSKATWHYDLSVQIPESVLAAEAANLAKTDTRPMGPAMLTPYFPSTGGRADIGPLPRWTALYLLSQDPRQRAVMLANADAAAGVPIHYRDTPTDQPVSIDAHPGITVRFGTASAADAVPGVVNGTTIWTPDTNHQASFAYIPYLVTGDAFYLDETLFWANWNMASKNPGYREFAKGLITSEEVRGQAWGLRSLGEASRALPDKHPLKAYFKTKLAANLAWYNTVYPPRDPNDTNLSHIGMVERGGDLHNTRPWMDDYVAIVLAQLAENDDPAALSYLQWLSRFTVGRFTQEPAGFCTAYAAAYTLQLFDATGQQITDWGLLFKRNWPEVASCIAAQVPVSGYPEWAGGYAATIRALLGASASAGIGGANEAYARWSSLTPKIQTEFANDPTWAIVRR